MSAPTSGTHPVSPEQATPPTEPRVVALPAAAELLRALRERHGPLMMHQSGGCCDGSSPMCYAQGDFIVGDRDVLLGVLDLRLGVGEVGTEPPGDHDGVPVWISGPQFELWKHTQLILDVVPGRGAGFSLEGPEGVRFLTRSRVFSDAESEALAGHGFLTGADWEAGARPAVPARPQVVATAQDACALPADR
ncbi:DUF779 domain-containing protein [Georgenia sp. AZ-5]|uniref:DUF779 domain-containing protein n=1 Tax=Georgenia sp. AZ-5 TaxID=3367526 RepID=UPI0037542512